MTEDIAELIAFSKEKTLPHDLGAVNIHNYNTVELDDTKQYNDFSGIRLLRMSTGIRYTGCIHERWVFPNGEPPKAMMLYNTWLKHDGYAYADKAAELAKHNRNMALLKKKLAEDPDDMQTLVECIDISKYDGESSEYARRVIEVINKKPLHWEKFGPVVYRGAVSVGKLQKLPELRNWIDQALSVFPNSIYTRVDVAYYALADYFDTGDYVEAVRWGAMYQNALSKYRAGEYDHSELLRGALEYTSPFWERKVFILMSHAYLELGEPEKAFLMLQSIKGEEIEEVKQIESVTNMMMRLHRTALLDTHVLVSAFWEQINQPVSDETAAKKRRIIFLDTASVSFTQKYRAEESGREDFVRHAYTLFTVLEGKCVLGTASAILASNDPAVLEEKLSHVENWSKLPADVLIHAMRTGVVFPLPNKPLKVEEIDELTSHMAQEPKEFFSLIRDIGDVPPDTKWQKLIWNRGLVLSAIKTLDWADENIQTEVGLLVAKTFARVEGRFLRRCYASEALERGKILALPPMHRFGWYCAQAFDVLDGGDAAGYVRLLREGLRVCEGVKDMVEFLLNNTPELNAPSDELKAMAEQIRAVLANFSPDDPAVAALKQSEVYQKVAYLIEQTD